MNQLVTDAAMDFLAMPVGIPQSWQSLSQENAQALLTELSKHQGFASQALERGTTAAEARTWLSARACGGTLDAQTVKRLASGVQDTTSERVAPYGG